MMRQLPQLVAEAFVGQLFDMHADHHSIVEVHTAIEAIYGQRMPSKTLDVRRHKQLCIATLKCVAHIAMPIFQN
jgi:hypothetical protein